MNLEAVGRWLLVAGLAIACVGGLIWLVGRFLPNLGKFLSDIPGTIRIAGSGFTCVIPLLASIVLSIVLTVVLNLIAKFLNH